MPDLNAFHTRLDETAELIRQYREPLDGNPPATGSRSSR
jgi:hypothetical protein